jgi:outer membrane protein assembly factor BamB
MRNSRGDAVNAAKNGTLALALLLATAGPARAAGFALRPFLGVYADGAGAALKAPEGVACSDDKLFVSDPVNARLVAFDIKDGAVVAGKEIKIIQATYPTRLALEPDGHLLVLDGRKRQIVRIDAAGGFVGALDFKPTAAFAFPRSMKEDAAGNVYVLDTTGKITVLDHGGAVTRQLEAPAADGAPIVLTDVAVDGAGKIYAVDAISATLWAADKSASALKPLTKSLKDSITFPATMVVVGGRLLVADQNGHGVVAVALDGSVLGRALEMGWSEGLVYYPGQICVNSRGETFVADRNNNRVQMFLPAQ